MGGDNVPTNAEGLEAWGMQTSDQRYELGRTHFETGARSTASEVRDIFVSLETQAVERLRRWVDGPIASERSAEMRYGEQIFEIDGPLSDIDLKSPALIADIEDRFHRRHVELYTYASRDQEVVFVNARVAAIGAGSAGERDEEPGEAATPCAPRPRRKAFFGEWREGPVYALEDLQAGHTPGGTSLHGAQSPTLVMKARDWA